MLNGDKKSWLGTLNFYDRESTTTLFLSYHSKESLYIQKSKVTQGL